MQFPCADTLPFCCMEVNVTMCVSLSVIQKGSQLFITFSHCSMGCLCVRRCYTLEDWGWHAACFVSLFSAFISSSSSSLSLPILVISWQTEETQLQKVIRNFQVNSIFFFVRIFHMMEQFDSYIGWPFFSFKMDLYYLFKWFISQFIEESILAI